MNWITTNIRLPEKVYFSLKMQAVKERKSVAALIREQLGVNDAEVQTTKGTAALVHFAQLAQQMHWKAGKDFAEKHDEYFLAAWKEEAHADI